MNTNIQNIRLHYEVKGNSGKVLLFLHGNSLSSETFREQFNTKELKEYQLMALDFPGHGKSEASNEPEKHYSLKGLAHLVADFVTALNLEEVVLAGHSLGGHVAIEAIPLISILKGVVVWGTPPVNIPFDITEIYLPNPVGAYLNIPNPTVEQLDQLINLLSTTKRQLLKDEFLKSDPHFRLHFPQSVGKGDFEDEVQIIKESDIPVLIMQGENEPIANGTYIDSLKDIPNLSIQKIPGAGHSFHLDMASVFNEKLLGFLKSL
jgi:pimeloyl-ACP methyl ester carboxylesterase